MLTSWQKDVPSWMMQSANHEVVILLLGRPYHSDPGMNHEVLDEFQSLGFKTISMRAIPKDEAYLIVTLKMMLQAGYISHLMTYVMYGQRTSLPTPHRKSGQPNLPHVIPMSQSLTFPVSSVDMMHLPMPS